MVSPSRDFPSKSGKVAVPCSTLRSALLTNFLTPPLAAPGGATARRLTASAEAATAARRCVPRLVFLRAINLFSLLRPGRTCEWVRATYDVEATEDASVGPYGRLSGSGDSLDRDLGDRPLPAVDGGIQVADAGDPLVRPDQGALRVARGGVATAGARDEGLELVVALAARVVGVARELAALPTDLHRVESGECVVRVHEHRDDGEPVELAPCLDRERAGRAGRDRPARAGEDRAHAGELPEGGLRGRVVRVLGDGSDRMARDAPDAPDVHGLRVDDEQRRRQRLRAGRARAGRREVPDRHPPGLGAVAVGGDRARGQERDGAEDRAEKKDRSLMWLSFLLNLVVVRASPTAGRIEARPRTCAGPYERLSAWLERIARKKTASAASSRLSPLASTSDIGTGRADRRPLPAPELQPPAGELQQLEQEPSRLVMGWEMRRHAAVLGRAIERGVLVGRRLRERRHGLGRRSPDRPRRRPHRTRPQHPPCLRAPHQVVTALPGDLGGESERQKIHVTTPSTRSVLPRRKPCGPACLRSVR